ncbi:BlaI/MecI/CopY family transcriptional regulator [Desulfosporosinus meridiei]|uniref:Putative transcriptional regulator n=1 Tax=Desulfosporosinus meridiei (strain ATCC BAA-275 / DSM 13257 / KCTC 12902 / NCIMB 13706 / S10) TaxID=768704 RepID=J7IZ42_DESMD|nr:BlaI/MecI/CopY family transcriptional regulator [Desulfosporosinus meridiei]AFQ43976.1 putative transcriptional regulator [Desulfosporosinus meridiei DSM 13257]
MKNIPNISDAEWEVMKICWLKSAPCTANEIVKALEEPTDWKPNTIKTLIGRLVKKGALGFKEEGRVYIYYPLVTEQECIQAESKSFLTRVFGGALKPMLVNFLKDEKLSQDDIEELKRLLEDRKE